MKSLPYRIKSIFILITVGLMSVILAIVCFLIFIVSIPIMCWRSGTKFNNWIATFNRVFALIEEEPDEYQSESIQESSQS